MKLTDEQADKYLDEILETIRETLIVKAKEYVRNADRMHNFNKAALLTGKSREEVIEDYRLKHIVSVDDIREDLKSGKVPSKRVVQEKYGDIINYYILELISVSQKIDLFNKSMEEL